MAAEVIPPPPDASSDTKGIPPPPDVAKSRMPAGGWNWGDPSLYDLSTGRIKDPEAAAAAKEQSRQGGVMAGTEKPQGMSDSVLQAIGSIPLMAAGGALGGAAKVGPAVGRMATEAGLSRMRGEDIPRTLVNVAGAGLGETAMKGVGKVAEKFAVPAQALEWIRERVGKGPDAATNLAHVDRLVSWWRSAPNEAARDAAGEYVVKELRQFGNEVAQMFRRNILRGSVHVPGVPAVRGQIPFGASQAAQTVSKGAQGPGARSAATALTGTSPFSAIAAQVASKAALPAMRHVPGTEGLRETISETMENE